MPLTLLIPLITLAVTDLPALIALIQQIVTLFNPSHPAAGAVNAAAAATPSLPDISALLTAGSMPSWVPALITLVQNDAGPALDGILKVVSLLQPSHPATTAIAAATPTP